MPVAFGAGVGDESFAPETFPEWPLGPKNLSQPGAQKL